MATIYDVARMASVSISTVSHVINGTRYVAEETRQRVLEAIEELDYQPSSLARALVRQETNTIGVVVPDNVNPFFAELARGIEDHGFSAGYSVILCNSDRNAAKQSAYLDVLIAKHVDGLIFMSFDDRPEEVDRITSRSIPVVMFDRDFPEFDAVLVDNYQGGKLATEHLVALGHRRIACIAGPDVATRSGQRVAAYRDVLTAAGIAVDEELILPSDWSFQSGQQAARQLLARQDRPTAIFCCNDAVAIGVMGYALSQGIDVPGDLSVVGFDNINLSSFIWPGLTTVGGGIPEMGRRMCQMLLDRINKEMPAEAQHYVMPQSLVVRDSSARARGGRGAT